MCGILGWFDKTRTPDANKALLEELLPRLVHRGPDDSGVWVNDDGLALGHRRLSIHDLSEQGHQPMSSPSGRFTCVYNGEIYNFIELKEELKGHGITLKGGSDTEVLLACFDQWGIENSLQKFEGMFALGVWDQQSQKFFLLRDRVGEKPLYYGRAGRSFIFSSEIKPILAHPDWKGSLSPQNLAQYFKFCYVPEPLTPFDEIKKLRPGHLLEIEDFDNSSTWQEKKYWSFPLPGGNAVYGKSYAEALESVEEILRRVVKQQLRSDVPLGAFLSGGVDSTTLVALMQEQSVDPIRTFTVSFPGQPSADEGSAAKAIASHLGTIHTELPLTSHQVLDLVPQMGNVYDEPFSDPSQVPTYAIAKLTREHVTVSLSGDGGDEIFAGYTRYLWTERVWQTLQKMGGSGQKVVGKLSEMGGDHVVGSFIEGLQRVLPHRIRVQDPIEKWRKFSGLVGSRSPLEIYDRLVSTWSAGEILTDPQILQWQWPEVSFDSVSSALQYLDSISYLPGDILVKVDRATMATSLESRAPYLNHKLIEYVSQLPSSYKIRDGKGKLLLRSIQDKRVPTSLTQRPKHGFDVPIKSWLRGDLKELAVDMLSEVRLRRSPWMNAEVVSKRLSEHLRGERDHSQKIWNILMFELWRESIDNKVGRH